MKNPTPKKSVNSVASLEFIMACMPTITDKQFFEKFEASQEITRILLAKKSGLFLN